MRAQGQGQFAPLRHRIEADYFRRPVRPRQLHGHQSRRPQPSQAEAPPRDAAESRQLLEGYLHAHRELERGNLRDRQRRRHLQQIFCAQNIELRITPLRPPAGVAPHGNTHAHLQRSHTRPERHHLAHRLVPRLPRQVGILQFHARKHRLPAENMQVPVGTGRNRAHPHQHLARSGLGHRCIPPDRPTGCLDLHQLHPRGNHHGRILLGIIQFNHGFHGWIRANCLYPCSSG